MKSRPGYTLVEVVIAILLTAVMVSAVFSIALTSKEASPKLDRKMAATQAANAVAQKMRNYITSDVSNTLIAGPSGGLPGAASWQIGGLYALTAGVHNLPLSYLPPEIAGMSGASISYEVAWLPSAAACPMNPVTGPTSLPGDCYPSIKVRVDWTE